MNKLSFLCEMQHKNFNTSAVYLCNSFPFRHVEMLKLNQTLIVEDLDINREYYNEENRFL